MFKHCEEIIYKVYLDSIWETPLEAKDILVEKTGMKARLYYCKTFDEAYKIAQKGVWNISRICFVLSNNNMVCRFCHMIGYLKEDNFNKLIITSLENEQVTEMEI
jgi:hypothetical protein